MGFLMFYVVVVLFRGDFSSGLNGGVIVEVVWKSVRLDEN